MQDFFIALVVLGAKEESPVARLVTEGQLSPYVVDLYAAARAMPMGRWLMIEVQDGSILSDVETLVSIRLHQEVR